MISIKLFYFQLFHKNNENDLDDSTSNANSLALLAAVNTCGLSSNAMGSAFRYVGSGSRAEIAKSTLTFAVKGCYGYTTCSKEVFAGFETLGETSTKTEYTYF